MKKILSLLLTLLLCLSLCVPASAIELRSFRDVPKSYWAHDAIMDMVRMGLLAGTTTVDADGVGSFDPEGTMLRSHFVAVVARYLYAKELSAISQGMHWYSKAYSLLLDHGILKRSDFENGNLETAMSRQEMAYVLANVAAVQKKAPTSLVETSKIPDYDSIDSYYRDSVVQAYSMGLITGTDPQGTFNPSGTLTRAQACMVIYRLVNYNAAG